MQRRGAAKRRRLGKSSALIPCYVTSLLRPSSQWGSRQVAVRGGLGSLLGVSGRVEYRDSGGLLYARALEV